MWEGYEHLVRRGLKLQTIRVDDPFAVGPVVIFFERSSGEVVEIPAEVVSVVSMRRAELTEEIARVDGFGSLAELQAALDRHYPGLSAEVSVDVVSYCLVSGPAAVR